MKALHHHPRRSLWSHLCILLAVLAALASVRPTQATARIRLVNVINRVTNQSSLARDLTAIGNTISFVADDGTHGYELWKSDGSVDGTTLVKDIHPTGQSEPGALTAVGSTLFFAADDGVHGRELWTSDGTEAGTTLVKDIHLTGASSPSDLAVMSSTLFFVADDGVHGHELWASDGTASGTVLVMDISPSSGSSSPPELTAVESRLFFSAYDGAHGNELWTSDGTTAGTSMLTNINYDEGLCGYHAPPCYFYSLSDLTAVGSILFFNARGGLWKSDGSVASTTHGDTPLPHACSRSSQSCLPVSLRRESAGQLIITRPLPHLECLIC